MAKRFASKSESDLNLVVTFIYERQAKLKEKYDNTSDLNWTVISILNDFRDSDNHVKTIEEVKVLMNDLKY